MKSKVLSIGVLILFFSSCIPSLHPIFTDANRIQDDRIIGSWVSQDDLLMKNDKLKLNLKVESEDSLDSVVESKILSGLFGSSEDITWRFERAMNLTYELNKSKSKSSKIELSGQRLSVPKQSLMDKGYEITKKEELPYYILTYSEKEDGEVIEDVLIVNLTKIAGELYMDFAPHEDIHKPTYFALNRIPAHTFAKVNFINGQLLMQSFDSDYIEKLIKSKRVRLKHELIEESIVLTASTEELRAFIAKYGKDEKLFMESDMLVASK